ncbi:MucR family transcriptional regulator [Methylobacterium dankookense]|uniref:Transcriptional regulatory protein ros n=1 Tax=Methylobacterium dankookense TaxID=560405 RepID=A0A564FZN8_9HYPH|nr:MucR family transcriptional regulator [Methylobacterium dankookense]GJD58478.1 Transcriptional regulatory protein ros [Methylobacterium dankookense]VUF13160.1 Transcriptional regulatory protein ros [Methylobacterium dankookense]
MSTDAATIDLAANIVSAYVMRNDVPQAQMPDLLRQVHAALTRLSVPAAAAVQKPSPSQIKASIRADGLISFEDGKSYKVLRRHLTTRGLTPEAYCRKWGLPRDYPMVAPAYSDVRSRISREIGLNASRERA